MTSDAFAGTADASPPSDAAIKRMAGIAGIFYLLVGIFGGFAEGYVEPAMYAVPTAQNLIANANLVRLGVAADLLDQAVFVALAVMLYKLLKGVDQTMARAMVLLVAVAAAIASLNVVFLFEALRVATDAPSEVALGALGVDVLVRLLLDMQHYGLLAAQVFFGLWLAPLGYLALKSGWFPKPLGAVLILAAGCYLIDLFTAFLVPDLYRAIHGFVVIPCAIAEIWMVLQLLLMGVRFRQPARMGTSGPR
jgi:Domain of unknown function (DUF4386)